MSPAFRHLLRRHVQPLLRRLLRLAPRPLRFAALRRLLDLPVQPDPRLSFKIAESQDELEACFGILHDAYVAEGLMTPQPSGLRVTPYHALPTTTTLCALFDGEVVATVSIVREGVFGFPMQKIFDIAHVRAQGGNIAEVSALAIHPDFRRSGGRILFPLMKFVHQYCTEQFDTRHLLIAVNPARSDLYEALLLFRRLPAAPVARYDFVNGAPAVGASLDFAHFDGNLARVYGGRAPQHNLHRLFFRTRLPNLQLPDRHYYTTNHAVLTPALMDHFFNRRTQVFAQLDQRQRCLLRSIYDLAAYAPVLPEVDPAAAAGIALRRHPRHSVCCPAQLHLDSGQRQAPVALNILHLGEGRFEAESAEPLVPNQSAWITVQLGATVRAVISARVGSAVRHAQQSRYAFEVQQADNAWSQCVQALQRSQTHRELALLA